ncbi:hypothetical protein OTSANNIE_0422 [Anaplasma phagocytophilum str. Annie]|nr:hypothetical protein APHWEB_0295 [Anaplasma phagocytophilum str. Webster]KJV82348.1 hypothetical protein APHHGE2_0450 [Anaplasma phagocytophilum str. HGE2]KJV88104.1 hypothetical protein APHNYW_0178 [Anaplasma phagocytophilum str. ApNYW]KJV99399.1 hypothetical protein OTSANNIE_0422 [Anaplasma phagocytophilum str. Annie]
MTWLVYWYGSAISYCAGWFILKKHSATRSALTNLGHDLKP